MLNLSLRYFGVAEVAVLTWASLILMHSHSFNCVDTLDSERRHGLQRRFTARA